MQLVSNACPCTRRLKVSTSHRIHPWKLYHALLWKAAQPKCGGIRISTFTTSNGRHCDITKAYQYKNPNCGGLMMIVVVYAPTDQDSTKVKEQFYEGPQLHLE